MSFFFFFQAEDGIRDGHVTGVQTCALPIFESPPSRHGASARVRTGRVMLIAIVAKGLELALNSVLTFVTDRLGSGRWLVSNAGVLFIAVAIALFDAFGHREPPP